MDENYKEFINIIYKFLKNTEYAKFETEGYNFWLSAEVDSNFNISITQFACPIDNDENFKDEYIDDIKKFLELKC